MSDTIYCPDCLLPAHLCGSHIADKCAGKKDDKGKDEPKGICMKCLGHRLEGCPICHGTGEV